MLEALEEASDREKEARRSMRKKVPRRFTENLNFSKFQVPLVEQRQKIPRRIQSAVKTIG